MYPVSYLDQVVEFYHEWHHGMWIAFPKAADHAYVVLLENVERRIGNC